MLVRMVRGTGAGKDVDDDKGQLMAMSTVLITMSIRRSV